MRYATSRYKSFYVLGLLLFFALALDTALTESPTVDESVHILRGYTLWTADDLRLQSQPPLSHWLVGSLLFTEHTLPDVTQLNSWQAGERSALADELIWQSDLNIERVFFLARLPIIMLGLLMGAVMVRWSAEYKRGYSQWLILLLFVFSSNLLAFSSLATTDLTVAATYLFAVFAFWRYRRRPSPGRWLLVGLCLGLALSAKLTAILLLPILLALSYAKWSIGQRWWRPALIWLSFLPVAGLVLWLLYRFEVGPLPGWSIPVPAATYAGNFLRVQGHLGRGHPAYLLGEKSNDGWWYYFLVAFAVKTPIPILLLSLVAVVNIVRNRDWLPTAYLWFPAMALFSVASYSRLNIGYRHILPVLPFVMLLAAGYLPSLLRGRNSRMLLGLLLTWYAAGALIQHPHHLAYFNELVGGPAQGYRYLGDSNVDWGQDLKLLADYLHQNDSQDVYYSYFGASDPTYYGIDQPPLLTEKGELGDFNPANPAAGRYAISVNHLLGMVLKAPDLFDWFRRQEPVGRLGYSILIYEAPPAAPGDWVAHCLDPAPAIDDQAYVAKLVNQTELRHVYFDCRTSWVFPNEARPGWYILPPGEQWPVGRYFPDHFRSVYADTSNPQVTPHEIYYWDGQGQLKEWLESASRQAMLGDGQDIDLPLLIGTEAQLIGHLADASHWLTLWRVLRATDDPLSLAGHLYVAGDPSPIVVDGLGYTSIQWRPGDTFLQVYDLEDSGAGAYLETGLYNYLTGKARTFTVANQTNTLVQLPFPAN